MASIKQNGKFTKVAPSRYDEILRSLRMTEGLAVLAQEDGPIDRDGLHRPPRWGIIETMFKRQRSGAVVCPSCGKLVGVKDKRCYNCGRPNPGMWGFARLLRLGHDFGFSSLVIGGSIALYTVSLLIDPGGVRITGMFSLLSPSVKALFILGASGALPVFDLARWWTVLSASWLHGGLLHIFFNMMWVRQLGPATADAYGAARMVIIYTAAGACGFLASSAVGHFLFFLPGFLRGANFTIGASASIFGLLGALLHYGRRRGSSALSRQTLTYALILGAFGFLMPGVDNWAHLGGFAGGYAMAAWLDPWLPERVDHVVGAIACLAATVVAILASVLTVLPALH